MAGPRSTTMAMGVVGLSLGLGLIASAAGAADAPRTPTFTKDVAPIFQA